MRVAPHSPSASWCPYMLPVVAPIAGRTRPSLAVQSTQYQRRGGCGADENASDRQAREVCVTVRAAWPRLGHRLPGYAVISG